MSLIQRLEWRYATKKMTGEKVPAEKVNNILRATQLAASSLGIQPYTILVIEDQATKEKLACCLQSATNCRFFTIISFLCVDRYY